MLWLLLLIIAVGFIISEKDKVLEFLKKRYQKINEN
tara:strand:- start:698 stop:805 length:108 start_codon:yes stop_codon:yes gene_type:complete